jgi:hypothetical protein
VYTADITYTDYFDKDQPRTERMLFNINAFELSEIMLDFEDAEEGLGGYMERALKEKRNADAFAVLKLLFVRGYGRRIEIDGRSRFIKKPEWILELLPSPEFEAFYLRLSSDTKFGMDFWNGLISKELLDRAEQIQALEPAPEGDKPAKKFRDMSLEEQVAHLQKKVAANETEKTDS